jgi:hypothetical protein
MKTLKNRQILIKAMLKILSMLPTRSKVASSGKRLSTRGASLRQKSGLLDKFNRNNVMNTFTTKMRKTRSAAIAALLGLGLMAGEASATIVLATHNVTPQVGAAAANLDLDGTLAGVQVFKFFHTTVPNQLVRVIFNAEGTIGGVNTTWLDDTIYIDGVPCAPSNSDNALVSGNGTATHNDGWVSAVTQCYARVPVAGGHNVRVLVTPFGAGFGFWRIDDLSLVIDTQ